MEDFMNEADPLAMRRRRRSRPELNMSEPRSPEELLNSMAGEVPPPAPPPAPTPTMPPPQPTIDLSSHSIAPSTSEASISLESLISAEQSSNEEPLSDEENPLLNDNIEVNTLVANTSSHTTVIVVWIVMMVLAAVIGVVSISMRRVAPKEDIVDEEPQTLQNYIELSGVETSAEYFVDSLIVHKVVEVTNTNISCLLTGEAENLGEVIAIPVTVKLYNTVSEGERITFYYDELDIDGESYINVVKWEKGG